jgi:hypothetical protein
MFCERMSGIEREAGRQSEKVKEREMEIDRE